MDSYCRFRLLAIIYMRFSPQLIEAVLVRRYKRFLADVRLADGSVITAHVANTGSMTGLDTPGLRVWLRDSQNGARKHRYSWELVEVPGEAGRLPPNVLVSVNTGAANLIVREAIKRGLVDELCGYDTVRAEFRHGHSRLDFLLAGRAADMDGGETLCCPQGDSRARGGMPGPAQSDNQFRGGMPGPDCYLEVKSVTLVENGVALFPDSVSARGTKHLEERDASPPREIEPSFSSVCSAETPMRCSRRMPSTRSFVEPSEV